MENDVLFNKVMNKTVIITLEWALTDPDDPLSGAYTFIKASMGPVALKNMQPPFNGLIQVIDDNGAVQGYEFAQGLFFNNDGTGLMLFTQDVAMEGTFATDSWAIHTE